MRNVSDDVVAVAVRHWTQLERAVAAKRLAKKEQFLGKFGCSHRSWSVVAKVIPTIGAVWMNLPADANGLLLGGLCCRTRLAFAAEPTFEF